MEISETGIVPSKAGLENNGRLLNINFDSIDRTNRILEMSLEDAITDQSEDQHNEHSTTVLPGDSSMTHPKNEFIEPPGISNVAEGTTEIVTEPIDVIMGVDEADEEQEALKERLAQEAYEAMELFEDAKDNAKVSLNKVLDNSEFQEKHVFNNNAGLNAKPDSDYDHLSAINSTEITETHQGKFADTKHETEDILMPSEHGIEISTDALFNSMETKGQDSDHMDLDEKEEDHEHTELEEEPDRMDLDEDEEDGGGKHEKSVNTEHVSLPLEPKFPKDGDDDHVDHDIIENAKEGREEAKTETEIVSRDHDEVNTEYLVAVEAPNISRAIIDQEDPARPILDSIPLAAILNTDIQQSTGTVMPNTENHLNHGEGKEENGYNGNEKAKVANAAEGDSNTVFSLPNEKESIGKHGTSFTMIGKTDSGRENSGISKIIAEDIGVSSTIERPNTKVTETEVPRFEVEEAQIEAPSTPIHEHSGDSKFMPSADKNPQDEQQRGDSYDDEYEDAQSNYSSVGGGGDHGTPSAYSSASERLYSQTPDPYESNAATVTASSNKSNSNQALQQPPQQSKRGRRKSKRVPSPGSRAYSGQRPAAKEMVAHQVMSLRNGKRVGTAETTPTRRRSKRHQNAAETGSGGSGLGANDNTTGSTTTIETTPTPVGTPRQGRSSTSKKSQDDE